MSTTESDQQRTPNYTLEWVALGILLGVTAVYAYHGWATGASGYLFLAAVVLVIVGLYATDYWSPVLYLLLAVVLTFESVRSVLNGSWRHLPVSIAVVLDLVFVVLAVYLFFRTEWSD